MTTFSGFQPILGKILAYSKYQAMTLLSPYRSLHAQYLEKLISGFREKYIAEEQMDE